MGILDYDRVTFDDMKASGEFVAKLANEVCEKCGTLVGDDKVAGCANCIPRREKLARAIKEKKNLLDEWDTECTRFADRYNLD
jgi:hypothetical protein